MKEQKAAPAHDSGLETSVAAALSAIDRAYLVKLAMDLTTVIDMTE